MRSGELHGNRVGISEFITELLIVSESYLAVSRRHGSGEKIHGFVYDSEDLENVVNRY